jgi:hypothetical protein
LNAFFRESLSKKENGFQEPQIAKLIVENTIFMGSIPCGFIEDGEKMNVRVELENRREISMLNRL